MSDKPRKTPSPTPKPPRREPTDDALAELYALGRQLLAERRQANQKTMVQDKLADARQALPELYHALDVIANTDAHVLYDAFTHHPELEELCVEARDTLDSVYAHIATRTRANLKENDA